VNKATQDTYNVKTGPDGNFTIQFIKIGTYSVTATKDGFSAVTQDGIQIDANQTVRTNFALQFGSVSENVVVTAGVPPVSTDNAAAKETVNSRAAVELPLNGRMCFPSPLLLPASSPVSKRQTAILPVKATSPPVRGKSRTSSPSTASRS
jgi:hypothetical protein